MFSHMFIFSFLACISLCTVYLGTVHTGTSALLVQYSFFVAIFPTFQYSLSPNSLCGTSYLSKILVGKCSTRLFLYSFMRFSSPETKIKLKNVKFYVFKTHGAMLLTTLARI
jgi:hypothetical protein